jgi:glycosyltransferase involved in cell wall biosynthesis
MKVILAHNYYQQPGGEDRVFSHERQLLESYGHQVVTYERTNSELLNHSPWEKLLLPKRVIWAEDARRDMTELLRNEKPDIVHVHNTFTQISPSIFGACREAGIPVVKTLHNFRLLCPGGIFFRHGKICEECQDFSLWRSVRHACYRDSYSATATTAVMLAVHRKARTWLDDVTGYIALSQFSRRKFIQGGLPPDKIRVKPNFIFRDPGQKNEAGEGAIYVGRLAPGKGVGTLLLAWRRLSARVPLQILGDGPARRELEAMASDLNLSQVTFRGFVSNEVARSAIKRARLLVLPSENYENFPVTIVEAFSCGTPILCSRLGAMQEIVTDGVTGLQFTPGSAEELAAKLDWAWSHPRAMEEMGKAARLEYEEKYTAERNYAMLMDIYRQAISSCQ